MALFTEERLRARVENQLRKGYSGSMYDSFESKAKTILNESLIQQKTFSATTKTYDIFLSHSSSDASLVAGLKLELEDLGYSVYVDWIEDPKLSRANVTKETALVLQARMKQCKALLYAFSENATNSKWMPWELGYFDGIKGTVAVLPISRTSKSSFQGSEYLGIYYYIQIDTVSGTNKTALWVYETATKYIIFDSWITGTQPIQR
ncbi:MAG: toll/interleukin-1 receptor domain-containing protein [Bacteroidia bacterium]|nr:toll/interleukin-1 receptor domain-containing protein [Bacteroidia bacterium]